MVLNHVNDVNHWRDRAAEMRILSRMVKDIEAQANMVRLADDYDKLAERAEQHSNAKSLQDCEPPSVWPLSQRPPRNARPGAAATMRGSFSPQSGQGVAFMTTSKDPVHN